MVVAVVSPCARWASSVRGLLSMAFSLVYRHVSVFQNRIVDAAIVVLKSFPAVWKIRSWQTSDV